MQLCVIFNLVLFPLREAPGCSSIRPFDSHTHKLTHAKTFMNSNDLCSSHLFLGEVRNGLQMEFNHRTGFCVLLNSHLIGV